MFVQWQNGKTQNLNPYLEGPREIRLVRNGTYTNIVLRLYNNATKSDKFVDIPIGRTNILKEGVYTGGFTKTAGTKFTKGERISLAELKRRFPGLDIVPDAGILMGDQVANYSGSEKFAKLNNGKTFIAVGELIAMMNGQEVFAAEQSGKYI